jgi:hypothetical protein
MNAAAKIITDTTCMVYVRLLSFLIGQKMELVTLPWVSRSWIQIYPERLSQQMQLKENIIQGDFSKISDTPFREDQLNPIVIIKRELNNSSSGYIVRRGSSNYDNISVDRSNTKFLSVEYSHPDMTSPIGIVMDKSWFFAGNELLNSTFILRMLEYQPDMYFFDEDYLVKIMDSECNIFTITSNEYILLTKEGYEVKMVEEPFVDIDAYMLCDSDESLDDSLDDSIDECVNSGEYLR